MTSEVVENTVEPSFSEAQVVLSLEDVYDGVEFE